MHYKRYCDVFNEDWIAQAEYESTLDPRNIDTEKKMVDAIPKNVKSVLDYACGTGRLSGYWTDYVGYDVSMHMLKLARKVRGFNNFTTTLPDRKFDAIIFDAILGHYTPPEIKTILDGVKDLTERYIIAFCWDSARGGKPTGSEYGTVSFPYQKEEWIAMLGAYGEVHRQVLNDGSGRIVYLVEVNQD
ncbi:hypothetical protein LCGC14_0787140 [marine sediment metagenome]|uniref:Methyltransferase domain-containing protein n=1 Tax=marine sediment metagenome TaxID=412755 RepID=A0A0F9PXZ2_9ZZZZ